MLKHFRYRTQAIEKAKFCVALLLFFLLFGTLLDADTRDKVSLDICWRKDQSLEDPESFPVPEVRASEIVENLEVALELFADLEEDLLEGQDG